MKRFVFWGLLFLFSVLPIVFWGNARPWGTRFSSAFTSLYSLGQIMGMIGIVWFSMSFVLSVRTRWLDWLMNGINRAYINHHFVGGLAFCTLLLHPLLLSGAYATISWTSALQFLWISEYWQINFGLASLLGLLALLFITFYVKLAYHIWKLTHQWLGLMFLLGGAHAIWVEGEVQSTILLRIYLAFVVVVGLLAFSYRTLLGRWLVKRTRYVLQEVKQLTDTEVELFLEPVGKPLVFQPGQFVFINFEGGLYSREVHPFSIASSSLDPHLRLVVKALGDYTNQLQSIGRGTDVLVEGPYGTFGTIGNFAQLIFVAGGVGITPFLSMVRSMKETGRQDLRIDLYYCVRELHEAVYIQELQDLQAILPNFRFILWTSREMGRLDATKIKEYSNDVFDTGDFFICGPPIMMKSLTTQLNELSVRHSRIHTEEFSML